MALKLPTKDFSAYRMRLSLEARPYIFGFYWNQFGEYWTMKIMDLDGSILASGIKLVIDYELIHDFSWLGLPPGELWAIDQTGELLTITRDSLHEGDIALIYIPEDEL